MRVGSLSLDSQDESLCIPWQWACTCPPLAILPLLYVGAWSLVSDRPLGCLGICWVGVCQPQSLPRPPSAVVPCFFAAPSLEWQLGFPVVSVAFKPVFERSRSPSIRPLWDTCQCDSLCDSRASWPRASSRPRKRHPHWLAPPSASAKPPVYSTRPLSPSTATAASKASWQAGASKAATTNMIDPFILNSNYPQT